MKNFSLKFIDVMIGIVLGLGFQWWLVLDSTWQYVAFIFVYLDIVDNWIDYSPSLKKFPPKREIDVFLDLGIMFTFFLYIYSTQLTIIYFLTVFIVFKILDYFWLWSSEKEYKSTGIDKLFLDTWMRFNIFEAIITGILIAVTLLFSIQPLIIIIIFIVIRIITRILASLRYKKVHFV
ncbi:hypothetical protein A3A05_02425 [Candidatus Nomurabacteria bacterium RIFCSPLOWO2_01_FULL_41_12]|uniref:Uncharacterized protein n=1 Tax=Candidatus Nomurabacteria bacterium RIFCSPLOWO2_01_FULL_41_12 TaxID=1801774 RepID=A0A1F6WUK6_9BACT|nr:MAG: hypothetical protein A2732_00270 [Candidatus Nomurabacteria bacterium RIFCSPHIGHO2_01_FULL_40_10]OGI85562.1 MAG: hypothetical protein A3A05_02425 [Candidatus Nomurabacteria bacterium RIFCSPLOWO2_01_FULL_41_12]